LQITQDYSQLSVTVSRLSSWFHSKNCTKEKKGTSNPTSQPLVPTVANQQSNQKDRPSIGGLSHLSHLAVSGNGLCHGTPQNLPNFSCKINKLTTGFNDTKVAEDDFPISSHDSSQTKPFEPVRPS
jgi:hypothetical protein